MMKSNVRMLVLAAMLALPSLAAASPITPGHWSAVGAAHADGSSFWDGASGDCTDCGVAAFLTVYGPLEYLHDGTGAAAPFAFAPVDWARLFKLSAWNGVFSQRSDGAFTYDSRTGHVSNSLEQGWQYALFRQVGPETTRYFIGVEDIRLDSGGMASDRDYNDFVVTFVEKTTVPEPATLLLMGTAMLAFARRFRR